MTAFEEIYKTYFNDVFRYIRRLSNDAQIAEEITAESFFKAMGAIDSFRGDCDVRVWLCQIAKNCYLSYLKEAKRHGGTGETWDGHAADPKETLEEQFLRLDEAERVRQLLHNIPEPYKEVFMWRVFAELSFVQIGRLFNKSENWACVTYHRARKKIQERLEEQNHEK